MSARQLGILAAAFAAAVAAGVGIGLVAVGIAELAEADHRAS